MDRHLGPELSAYLDDELDPTSRAGVESHLDACAVCRVRLGELRATVRLIAALPLAAPTRSLVPRVAVAPNWLRPFRSLSAVATGAFVFLFMASAVLESGTRFGGGLGAGAPQTTSEGATAEPGRGASGPILGSPAPDLTTRSAVGAASPSPAPAALAPAPAATEKTAALDAAPQGQQEAASPGAAPQAPPQDEAARSADAVAKPQLGPPALWLILAIVAALAALIAHRRIRAA